jgi:general secretion pathway protein G
MKITRRGKAQRGFTLIEVLVVLAILAMMAAMVMPRILGRQKTAKLDAVKTQIGALQGALDQYVLDMNTYPTTEQGLEALIKKPEQEEDGPKGKWNGPYLGKKALPKDPWGEKYQYEFPSERAAGEDEEESKTPAIWSYGPDGMDETDDDMISWTEEGEDEEDEFGEDSESSSDSGSEL